MIINYYYCNKNSLLIILSFYLFLVITIITLIALITLRVYKCLFTKLNKLL